MLVNKAEDLLPRVKVSSNLRAKRRPLTRPLHGDFSILKSYSMCWKSPGNVRMWGYYSLRVSSFVVKGNICKGVCCVRACECV